MAHEAAGLLVVDRRTAHVVAGEVLLAHLEALNRRVVGVLGVAGGTDALVVVHSAIVSVEHLVRVIILVGRYAIMADLPHFVLFEICSVVAG